MKAMTENTTMLKLKRQSYSWNNHPNCLRLLEVNNKQTIVWNGCFRPTRVDITIPASKALTSYCWRRCLVDEMKPSLEKWYIVFSMVSQISWKTPNTNPSCLVKRNCLWRLARNGLWRVLVFYCEIEQRHQAVLNELHKGLPGICKMKVFARMYVWWSGIYEGVEKSVQLCHPCQLVQVSPS